MQFKHYKIYIISLIVLLIAPKSFATEIENNKLENVANSLIIVNADAAYGNINLPTNIDGVKIKWISKNEKIISPDGIVKRPKYNDKIVNLVANLEIDNKKTSKSFKVKVKKFPKIEPNKAYLFVHFTFSEEKIHFSISNGNNALSWQELNSGKPIFISNIGTLGLRDPYIIRSPEGDTFYLMATDLKWFSGPKGIDRNRYIQVWESHDLVNWSKQRDVLVSPPNVKNTYAPEAIWDNSIGAYVVFWTSKIDNNDYFTPMYATTRDFVNFTEAKVWQPNEWRIDSTIIKVDDYYYRFTKSIDKSHNNCHDIVEERSKNIFELTEKWETIDFCIGAKAGINESEAPLTFKSNTGDVNGDYYYMWMERWIPNKTYVALRTKSLENPKWEVVPVKFPNPLPKHGAILPISEKEAKLLLKAFPSNSEIKQK